MAEFHAVGVGGSLRKASLSTNLLRAAVELAPPELEIELLPPPDLPLFNQDLEATPPASVREFREKVFPADAIVFGVNEHNFSISAALKNALDWGSRPFPVSVWAGKTAAILGASNGRIGGERAELHLRQILTTLDVYAVHKPEVIVSNTPPSFDADGHLVDPVARERVRAHLVELVRLTRRGPGKA